MPAFLDMAQVFTLGIGLGGVANHCEIAQRDSVAGSCGHTCGESDGQAEGCVFRGQAYGVGQGERVAPTLRVPGLAAGENSERGVS